MSKQSLCISIEGCRMSMMSGCQPSLHSKIFGITNVDSSHQVVFISKDVGMSRMTGCQPYVHPKLFGIARC